MEKKKRTLENAIQFLWLFLLAVCIIVFYKTIDSLPAIFSSFGSLLSVFTPLLIALILFFFLSKPTASLERKLKICCIRGKYPFRCFARGISVLIAYLGLFAIVALILYALLPMLANGIRDFVLQVPEILQSVQDFARNISEGGNILASLSVWEEIISLSPEKLISYFPVLSSDAILDTISKSFAGVKSVSTVLTTIFVSIVLSVYICLERDMLRRFVSRVARAFLKDRTIQNCKSVLQRMDFIILRYFFGQFCDSLIVSLLASVTLELLGVPYGIVLGFLFGMFNLIPYFGPIIIFFVVILITLISSGWGITIWAAILLLLIQQIDGNIINPKILGNSLNISPFWVILAVTIGGDLFGIVGMLISVPVFAVIRLFVLDFLKKREIVLKTRQSKTEPAEAKPEAASDSAEENAECPQQIRFEGIETEQEESPMRMHLKNGIRALRHAWQIKLGFGRRERTAVSQKENDKK